MFSHGIVSGALFLCVGILYDSMHTKKIADFGGVASKMPIFSGFFLLFVMASIGLPGTSGFVGEFMCIVGMIQDNAKAAYISVFAVVLGAMYMLSLYKRVMLGTVQSEHVAKLTDINQFETFYLTILAALVIYMGVFPTKIIDQIMYTLWTQISN
jgi:NADH-quinone oxidoreductase subunit M